MTNLNSYSKKIIESYEKNIYALSLYKAWHFLLRAYRINGKLSYENFLAYYTFLLKMLHFKGYIQKIKAQDFEITTRKISAIKSLREKNRQLYYRKNPKIKFYNNLLTDMFFVKMLGLDKILKNEMSWLIKTLKNETLENIYLQKEAIQADSSFVFTSVFFLEILKIKSISQEATELVKSMYLKEDLTLKKTLAEWEFLSFIYSLTHIIISESSFYEKKVEKYSWIIDFFAKNIDLILENCKLDILAEVGLCFKLSGKEKEYETAYKKIINSIVKKIEKETFTDPDLLIKKEHTNSVLMLLFSDKKSFFSWPDLSKNEEFLKLTSKLCCKNT